MTWESATHGPPSHPLVLCVCVWCVATRAYAPFECVGEYVGKVVPPGVYGDYVATIDYGDRYGPQYHNLMGLCIPIISHSHFIG